MRGKNKILLLAGPSAAGKTTVARCIENCVPTFSLVRSATTRSPRGDGNDSEYLYMSREEFLSCVREGGFLEHTEFSGSLYGTPSFEIERIISEGGTPVLILDLNGIQSLRRSSAYPIFAVYLFADEKTLDSRLYDRITGGGEMTEELARQYESRRAKAREYKALVEERRELFDAFVDTSKRTPDEVAREILSLLNK